jgi:hypothetical protein
VAFLQRDEASMQEQVAWALGKRGAATLFMEQCYTDAYYGSFAKGRELAQRVADAAKQGNIQDSAIQWTADDALTEVEIGKALRKLRSLSKGPFGAGPRGRGRGYHDGG